MARALQIGERVMVKRRFQLKPDSAAYQQGLKSVGPNLIGEVAGPAPEGRAWLVSFNGIQVPVTKQNLVRAEEVAKPSRGNDQPTAEQVMQKDVAPKPVSLETEQTTQDEKPKPSRGRHLKTEQPSTQEQQPAPRRRGGRRSGAVRHVEPPSTASELDESGLQLLNFIANKMLLKGTVKVQPETAVEVSLSYLPVEVQQQLQRLIDAKLSLGLKSLVR